MRNVFRGDKSGVLTLLSIIEREKMYVFHPFNFCAHDVIVKQLLRSNFDFYAVAKNVVPGSPALTAFVSNSTTLREVQEFHSEFEKSKKCLHDDLQQFLRL